VGVLQNIVGLWVPEISGDCLSPNRLDIPEFGPDRGERGGNDREGMDRPQLNSGN